MKNDFQSPADLRAKEWMKLEEKILQRALALWRRKGRRHLDAVKALRQAEREILSSGSLRQ